MKIGPMLDHYGTQKLPNGHFPNSLSFRDRRRGATKPPLIFIPPPVRVLIQISSGQISENVRSMLKYICAKFGACITKCTIFPLSGPTISRLI